MPVRWKPDHDCAESVDDFTATDVSYVRFERMNNGTYWFAVFLNDGREHHFDFHLVPKRRRINVFARQPSDLFDPLLSVREVKKPDRRRGDRRAQKRRLDDKSKPKPRRR